MLWVSGTLSMISDKKSVFLLLAIVFVLVGVAGCSSTPETAQTEAPAPGSSAPEPSSAAGTTFPSEQPTGTTPDQATPQPTTEPPTVEVIANTQTTPELNLKPIPEQIEPSPESAKSTESPATGQGVQTQGAETADTEAGAKIPPTGTSGKSSQAMEPGAVAKPEITVPVSTGPDNFVITADLKDARHPLFGKGHTMGFLVNNVPGKELVLERGKTYRFDVATDPKHDVYISTKLIGWGSTPWTEGVEGMYTYNGIITVKPTQTTPGVLYYSCRNHPYMGGKINIVNPGEQVAITQPAAVSETTGVADSLTRQGGSTPATVAAVNQKLMFADMLANSATAKRVSASNIAEAVAKQNDAKQKITTARDQLAAGDNQAAFASAESAVALLKEASKMVPDEDAMEHLQERYKELQASLKNFEESHEKSLERIVKKQGDKAGVAYDKNKVQSLKQGAADAAGKGDYVKATADLEQAQYLVTAAIQQMLESQTIVYDLNFESAQEEYEYELRRFTGYEELIPIAIEQKKPAEGALKLMETYLKEGKDLRDQAVEKAKQGDFPVAIAMLLDATNSVRRALRMVGVMQ
jgi:hypothetical protein